MAKEGAPREERRPQFHLAAERGQSLRPLDFYREQGRWHLWYEVSSEAGKIAGQAVGGDRSEGGKSIGHGLGGERGKRGKSVGHAVVGDLSEGDKPIDRVDVGDRNECGKFVGHVVSGDLLHWQEADQGDGPPRLRTSEAERGGKPAPDCWQILVDGRADQEKWLLVHEDDTYSVGTYEGDRFVVEGEPVSIWHGSPAGAAVHQADGGRCVRIGFGQETSGSDEPFGRQLRPPAELKLRSTERGIKLGAEPVEELQNLRVWHRCWTDIEIDDRRGFEESLRFRIAPGEWPDIRIVPGEGKPDDIWSDSLDALLELDLEGDSRLDIRLYGISITLDRGQGTIACGGFAAPLPIGDGANQVTLRLLLDTTSLEIFICGGEAVLAVPAEPDYEQRQIRLSCEQGSATASIDIFGLRGVWPDPESRLLIEQAKAARDDEAIYRSDSYTVYRHRIEDSVYGEPHAYVPDRDTIVSPTRVVEDFSWRPSGWNDMTRVIDRGNVWRPQEGIAGLPDLRTGHATIDAAYCLASDVFYRCGSPLFARPGEEGMWTAGLFQGPGEGFGVWVRDTAHVAIRTGNLLDPEGARRSLLYTTQGGFDNGVDGTAMPIVGIWDYYLATGDLSLMQETWDNLKLRIARLEASFDPEQGLIPADQSTSNDAFPEPECGGFSLATEIYFMEAFRAMSRMAAYMGEPDGVRQEWADRGELLLRNIRSRYWKEEAGYFASGPTGSESHSRGYWESAGQEAAMWPRFGVATREQRRSMLERLPEVAMNEFGVNVFPYRPESNHFCNSAWVVWTSGMAAAAGREGRLDLLMAFIAQQTRNGVMNKTFYEAIDYRTGRAWRWPGQLWHAAGFLSYFYLGVLGMEYDERGLAFAPAVPEALRDLRVERLRYRKAVFDIVVHGWGTAFAMTCDGVAASRIPADTEGYHLIELRADASGS